MFKTTPKYIRPVFRHLTIVVVFLAAFLFFLDRTQVSFSPISPATATKVVAKAAYSLNAKSLTQKVSLKVFKKRTSLEAILPLQPLSFKLPVAAFKLVANSYSVQGFSFISQQLNLILYAARAPGKSLISKIFTITIQPNAP
ncbi:hypothetical protein [Adhaeribacter radiodurans]|uniref:Uncharacterized protein n=1 Tax=Adhaeribacter radiodurans TaxID=2745197 RepID=A0A7L7LAT7_9BACT|nr:hypothetical protein [Adhaeribacter radiodurans]QMU29952.1 hypothetical protein HUW48_18825 [Adhaeribacter radiodurans]